MSLSPTDAARAVTFIENDHSQRYDANILGLSQTNVHWIYSRSTRSRRSMCILKWHYFCCESRKNQYLTDANIETMICPSRSPDLNSIEHVWDMMIRQIRLSESAPDNFWGPRNVLIDIQEQLNWNSIRQLVNGMCRYIEVCIRTKVGNTKYLFSRVKMFPCLKLFLYYEWNEFFN